MKKENFSEEKSISIGCLAKLTDTKVETIRYYEKIALLPKPPRSEGNYRLYGKAHFQRLSFIRRARKLGFHIETIKALLGLESETAVCRTKVRQIAQEQLKEVENKLKELQALEKNLKALIKQCPNGKISGCGIIDALNGEIF
ncbi:MerR family transcriptional regulator [Acetobacteraceae bacterium]|nr:MerR family transcriptional regulator [Acetobacteraceae bacterium]QCE33021.1 MerR family transcriptional regulator [Acetobacteraceae bacterium]